MNLVLPDPTSTHKSSEAGFEIVVKLEIPRQIIMDLGSDVLKIFKPVAHEKLSLAFNTELAKETRPYRWQSQPALEERATVDAVHYIISGRAIYMNLTSDPARA